MNPWEVASVQEFAFLNCPECAFKHKEESSFQDHALKYHPRSSILFETTHELTLSDHSTVIENIIISDIIVKDDNQIVFQESHEYVNTAVKDDIPIIHTKEKVLSKKDDNVEEFFIQVLDENKSAIEENEKEEEVEVEPLKENDLRQMTRKKTKSVQALINVLEELSDDPYKCITCEKAFPRVIDMKEHCKAEHTDKDGKFICKHCGKGIISLRRLVAHIRNSHVSKKCQICGKVLKLSVFNRHMVGVHGDKNKKDFKCDSCSYTTHCGKYLYAHKFRAHTPNGENRTVPGNLFVCPQCQKTFTTKANMMTHVETLHDTGLAEYSEYLCDDCGLGYDNPNVLLTHSQSVHKTIPKLLQKWIKAKCDQCDIYFLSKGILTRHKGYMHAKNPRNQHIRGDVPEMYQCKYCDKPFKSERNCREHVMVVHEKNTPHQCKLCSRKFGLKSNLRNHMQVKHNRMTCDICGQEQYNGFYLKRHKASAHGVIPPGHFKCPICPDWFKHKANIEKHIKTKHPILTSA